VRYNVYATLIVIWAAALAIVIRRQRRSGEPLFNRPGRGATAEQTSL
jgi:hypothetical protein